MHRVTSAEVLVVGAGPAGLAVSRELSQRGVDHLVLERGPRPAHTWENLYESLRLHTGKHLSTLPGLRFAREVPLFPSRADLVEYLHHYADLFRVPVISGCEVTTLQRREGDWLASTCMGTLTARAVIVATGIVANPVVPRFPGQERFAGRVRHSVEYRRPEPFAGRRVLVVGVGNSGGEIASELAGAGARVTVAVRSGANVVPLTLFGLPIQYAALVVRKLPRPAQERMAEAVEGLSAARHGTAVLPRSARSSLEAIPLIGFGLIEAIRSGRVQVRGAIGELTERGVRFQDGAEQEFDEVILATGFRPALALLDGLVRCDERGFARRVDRVASADQPGLFFVGHNYDTVGALYNISRDAALAADAALACTAA